MNALLNQESVTLDLGRLSGLIGAILKVSETEETWLKIISELIFDRSIISNTNSNSVDGNTDLAIQVLSLKACCPSG
jgi:hypothetical protein